MNISCGIKPDFYACKVLSLVKHPPNFFLCFNLGAYLSPCEVSLLVIKCHPKFSDIFQVSMPLPKCLHISNNKSTTLLSHNTLSSHKMALMCRNFSCFVYCTWRMFMNWNFDVCFLVLGIPLVVLMS